MSEPRGVRIPPHFVFMECIRCGRFVIAINNFVVRSDWTLDGSIVSFTPRGARVLVQVHGSVMGPAFDSWCLQEGDDLVSVGFFLFGVFQNEK